MVSEILDSFESTVKKIKEKTGLSEEQIRQKVAEKQEEYGGLLTEAGAAYSIAKEHGVSFEGEEKTADSEKELKIKDLKEGTPSFDITVTAKAVYPTKHFEKGSMKGEVTNIEAEDDTGSTRLVVWGKSEELQKIGKGCKLKIKNAYTKMNRDRIEIHLGSKGSFEASGNADKTVKMSEIKDGMDNIDFHARVIRPFPVYEFNKDGKTGKVSSVTLTDGTETLRLVLWNDNADSAKELYTNDLIKVENAYARKNNELEVHLGWRGRVIFNQEADIPEIKVERKTISALSEDKDIEIKADVVELYPPTVISLCAKCKKMIREGSCEDCGNSESVSSMIINAELDDGTGTIRGTFYRDKAEQLLGLKAEKFTTDIFETLKKEVLGKQFIMFGEVKDVPEYSRKEFIVRRFAEPKYDIEIKKLSEVM